MQSGVNHQCIQTVLCCNMIRLTSTLSILGELRKLWIYGHTHRYVPLTSCYSSVINPYYTDKQKRNHGDITQFA